MLGNQGSIRGQRWSVPAGGRHRSDVRRHVASKPVYFRESQPAVLVSPPKQYYSKPPQPLPTLPSKGWSGKTCVVVGGGISGLCSALEMANLGFRTRVFEAKAKWKVHQKVTSDTSMVVLNVDGMQYLEQLGIDTRGEACRKTLFRASPDAVERFLTSSQSGLLRAPASVDDAEAWYCCSHQALCQLLLLECMEKHCGKITVVYENTVDAIELEEQRVLLKAVEGGVNSAPYDVLVGADGRNSFVRTVAARADPSLTALSSPLRSVHVTTTLARALALEAIGHPLAAHSPARPDYTSHAQEAHFPHTLVATTVPSDLAHTALPSQLHLQLYPERAGSNTICCSISAPEAWWSEAVPDCAYHYGMFGDHSHMTAVLEAHFPDVPHAALDALALQVCLHPRGHTHIHAVHASKASTPWLAPGVALVGHAALSVASIPRLPAQTSLLTAKALGQAFEGTTAAESERSVLLRYRAAVDANWSALSQLNSVDELQWSRVRLARSMRGALQATLHNVTCCVYLLAHVYSNLWAGAQAQVGKLFGLAARQHSVASQDVGAELKRLQVFLLAARATALAGALALTRASVSRLYW